MRFQQHARGTGQASRGQLDPADSSGGVSAGEKKVESESAGGLGTGTGGEF